MNKRIEAAETAAYAAAELMTEVGLTRVLGDLVSEVWGANLERYEPEERGDTTKSLGFQCSENIRELAVRRIQGGDLAAPEDHWNVPGLQFTTPRGVLTLHLPGLEIVLMKVPYAHGRSPIWEHFPNWETSSQIRDDIAKDNARVLGGSKLQSDTQSELEFPEDTPIGIVRRMMVVWAGEPDASLTSAWLTVPVSWSTMTFAAKTPLWRDEAGDSPSMPVRTPKYDGPSFDQQPTVEPQITMKPRPVAEGEA
ncbi:MAG: hypothetical protein CMJ44_06260 [Pimelobacter sp.]|nr:hypothetical protein [Pimelobacter sp.]